MARLQLVDTQTGELSDHVCRECSAKDDQIAGLERDIRGWRARYADLARDREADARQHPLWDEAKALFGEWKLACGHPRCRFDAGRFELVKPFLERYGVELCRRAIAGASFDPFTTTRKNGSVKRHDDWELVFRNAGKFEEFCNRAPREAAA